MLAILIDLSKAFHTVDHRIFVTKLKNLGVQWTNLGRFNSHLENHKEFIAY